MSGRFPLCALERAIHGDEPLGRRQENDRVVAAPAVWIGVMERFAVPEASALFEGSLHVRVRVEDALPAKQLDVLKEVTSGPDGRVDFEPVLDAGLEVVATVTRCRVDRPRPLFDRDVVGEHTEGGPRVERVLEADVLQLGPLHSRDRTAEAPSDGLRDRLRQRFRHDDGAPLYLVRAVVHFRVEGDREVRGDRPGSRRPDQDGHAASVERRNPLRELAGALRRQRKLHVDRWRGVVLGTRLPLQPAQSGNGCTNGPASSLCRRAPARRTFRARARWRPGT